MNNNQIVKYKEGIFSKIKNEETKNNVKEEIATNLSHILGMEKQTVMDKLNQESSYVIIKRQVEQPEAEKINAYIAVSDYGVSQYIGLDESTKR